MAISEGHAAAVLKVAVPIIGDALVDAVGTSEKAKGHRLLRATFEERILWIEAVSLEQPIDDSTVLCEGGEDVLKLAQGGKELTDVVVAFDPHALLPFVCGQVFLKTLAAAVGNDSTVFASLQRFARVLVAYAAVVRGFGNSC